MWFSKIRKNKKQFILVFIIITVISCVLSTCISLTSSVNDYVDDYYAKYYDEFVFLNLEDEKNSLTRYFDEKEIDYVETQGYSVDFNVYLNGRNLKLKRGYIAIINDDYQDNPWNLTILEQENESIKPTEHEIWVPKIVADACEINIGDKVTIKNDNKSIDYKVTTIVNDALEPTTIIGNNNFYVDNSISEIMSEDKTLFFFGYNYSAGVSISDDFEDYLGHTYYGSMTSAKAFSNVAKLTTVTVGGIGLIASILIFIAAIIVIRFILWNSILREYKNIGIYKALGFSNRKIANIYLTVFGMPSLVGVILGSIASFFVSNQFVSEIVKYIGSYKVKSGNVALVLISSLALFVVYMLTLDGMLKKLKTIDPVEALTIGIKRNEKKLSASLIKHKPNPFALAINDIVKYKKQNIMIFTIFIMVSFLVTFFYNINCSVMNIQDYTERWFGNMVSDCIINTYDYENNRDDIYKYLDDDPDIKEYRYGCFSGSGIVSIDTEAYNIGSSTLIYSAYNDYDENNNFSCMVDKGRNPNNKNEIAIAKNIASDSGLDIGDKIVITVDGKEKELEVVGIYSSIYNNSYTYRIMLDLIPEDCYQYMNIDIVVALKNPDDIASFSKTIEDKFAGTQIEKISSDIENGLSDLDIINPIIIVILAAIVLFCMLNVINIIMVTKIDNRKNYGIMKAIGFSNAQIICRMMFRIMMVSMVASALGYLIYFQCGSYIFKAVVLGIDGIVHIIQNDIAILGMLNAFIFIVSLISMLSIKNISTVELMEE